MKKLTIEEIKQLFEYYDNDEFQSISEMLKDSRFNANIDEMTSEEYREFDENFFKQIVSRIDEKEYDSLLEDEEIDEFYLEGILSHANNSEIIKKFIQNGKNRFNELSMAKLVIATKDKQFMYQVLANSNEYFLQLHEHIIKRILQAIQGEEHDLDKNEDLDMVDLILETKNVELIKSIIKGNNTFDKNKLIIGTNNPEYIKKCIEDSDFHWTTEQLIDLITATKDEEYMKTWLQGEQFSSDEKKEVLRKSNNIELIKECIQNKDIYGLSQQNVRTLLLETSKREFVEKATGNNPELVEDILKSNKEYIIKILKNNESFRSDRLSILEKLNDKELTKTVIEDSEFDWSMDEVCKLAISTGDAEFIKKMIQNEEIKFSISQIAELIVAIGDGQEEFIKDTLNSKYSSNGDKIAVLNQLGNEKIIKEYIEDEEFGWDKNLGDLAEFLISTQTPEYIKEFMQNHNYNWAPQTKFEIICATKDKDDILGFIIEHTYVYNYVPNKSLVIETIDEFSEERKHKILKKIHDAECDSIIYDYVKQKGIEYFKENAEFLIGLEGINEKDISYKKDCITKMYETNNEILRNIDYKILQPKYVDRLGLDKINQIACYSEIQKKVLELNESELLVFSKCIENCNSVRWTPLAQAFLDNLLQYNELIENISQFEEEQINFEKINLIVQDKNIFEIKTLQDVENFEQIRKQKCDKWIKSDNIEEKKLAVLEKIYGQSLEYSKTLIQKYGQDIDAIQDGDLKDYVKSVKAILKLDDKEVIEEIYEKCKEVENIDKIGIEEGLKSEYGKLFNEGLFTIEQAEELEEGVYEAGTDFKIILTSISAYIGYGREISNYKEDWNRPAIAAQHFCTSYIRNDMMGTAQICNICYRFF